MNLFYKMNFLQSKTFLTELDFLKGDTNIYFKKITFFEKKPRDFVKIMDIFFLKIYIFFNLLLLHLNNHSQQVDENGVIFFPKKKKKIAWGKSTIWAPKMTHPHNSGFPVAIFFKFCTMIRANRQMKVIIMVCTKKNLLMTNGPFQAQKWHIVITQDRP